MVMSLLDGDPLLLVQLHTSSSRLSYRPWCAKTHVPRSAEHERNQRPITQTHHSARINGCRTYSTLTFNPCSARYLMYARGIGASRKGRPNFSSVMKTMQEIFFLRFSFQMMTFKSDSENGVLSDPDRWALNSARVLALVVIIEFRYRFCGCHSLIAIRNRVDSAKTIVRM
jgi:hypothetical protein